MPDALSIAFWALAAITVGSGLMVIWLRDLFRAALFLATLFLGVAGLYVLLQADFLAAAQVLIYVGAVSVLLIFAIFLTHDVQRGNPPNSLRLPALIVALLVFVALAGVFVQTPWPTSADIPPVNTTPALADAIFNKWALPFEAASVLLVAALIGAIVLARED
jgi:NADH:ubiquinone oxidoreductase subunit 6 (subunit J)